MNLSTRSVGLALLLLLLFLGTTVTLQWWLAHETHQLRAIAIEEQRAHLLQAITVSGRSPENWDAIFQRELGAMLGGTVELLKPNASPSPMPRDFRGLAFTQDLPSAPGWRRPSAVRDPCPSADAGAAPKDAGGHRRTFVAGRDRATVACFDQFTSAHPTGGCFASALGYDAGQCAGL